MEIAVRRRCGIVGSRQVAASSAYEPWAVVDGSIVPAIITGDSPAPCVISGERLAEML